MSPPIPRVVTVEALDDYAERIDVRSPAEYAEDHLPGAQSHPVLSNDERAHVGTLYAREGAFGAKRIGASMIGRNIATLLERDFAHKSRDWMPLVYCWRGGKRSAALSNVLNEIGWHAVQLEGGYRAFRRHVLAALETLPTRFEFRVVCGLTGSGKSRLIGALASEGAQVLDLERLAAHRGSLLGDLPDAPQPSQKHFETEMFEVLHRFDPRRPVYVESESKRIGRLQVPEALLAAMRDAECIRIELPPSLRAELLREEYVHFFDRVDDFVVQLAQLTELHGKDTIERWIAAARAGDWRFVVSSLLAQHYDPLYTRSTARNFPRHEQARILHASRIDDAHFRELARALVSTDEPVVSA